jgi:hypothetical protein
VMEKHERMVAMSPASGLVEKAHCWIGDGAIVSWAGHQDGTGMGV